MAISKVLFGVTREIPQPGERAWGNEVTTLLSDMVTALNGAIALINSIPVNILSTTSTTLADAATLSPTHTRHLVASSTGGAVTLSATNAIADVTAAGRLLILEGTSDSATVTIPNGANTDINGPMLLRNGSSITLLFNLTRSLWVELARNE